MEAGMEVSARTERKLKTFIESVLTYPGEFDGL